MKINIFIWETFFSSDIRPWKEIWPFNFLYAILIHISDAKKVPFKIVMCGIISSWHLEYDDTSAAKSCGSASCEEVMRGKCASTSSILVNNLSEWNCDRYKDRNFWFPTEQCHTMRLTKSIMKITVLAINVNIMYTKQAFFLISSHHAQFCLRLMKHKVDVIKSTWIIQI